MVLTFALMAHCSGVMEFSRFSKQMLTPSFVVGNHRSQGDSTGFLTITPAQPMGANGL